jgi:hypothetical protein
MFANGQTVLEPEQSLIQDYRSRDLVAYGQVVVQVGKL